MEKDKDKRYRRNHRLVLKKFFEYLEENGFEKEPTITELSEITELHRHTIREHLKELNLDEVIPEYKQFIHKVTMGLIKGAESGKASNAELYYKIFYKYVDKREIDITEPIEVIIKRESKECKSQSS